MQRYILTGTPGSGKTAILRSLEINGYPVVEEAATDVIALEQARGSTEPWTTATFISAITTLQRRRQLQTTGDGSEIQFFDRSPVCTLALSMFLGQPVPPELGQELDRIEAEHIYQRQVFFIENMGFITPTDARKITLTDALRFERIHAETYQARGYECVRITPGPLHERVAKIRQSTRRP